MLEIESKQIDLLRTFPDLDISVVFYSPFSCGMPTSTFPLPDDFYDSNFRKVAPRFSTEDFANDQLGRAARQKDTTSTRLIICWLIAQSEDVLLTLGITSLERLEDDVRSRRVKVSKGVEQRVGKLYNEAAGCGGRYLESRRADCYTDTPP
jgi:aryl-alcohol dehydrogenase-like predicted oxidoreductase